MTQPNSKRRPLLWLIIAVSALGAGLAGGLIAMNNHPMQRIASGVLLDAPRTINDFTLLNANGGNFTRADLLGHWTVLFPGYTYCPDVCPTTLVTFKSIASQLGADASKVRFLFISVDPDRDTPARLAQYVHYFSPDFEAATGPDAELQKLGADLGFVYQKVPGSTPGTYLMDHSAALILINPQAQLVGYIMPPFKAETVSADLRSLTAQS